MSLKVVLIMELDGIDDVESDEVDELLQAIQLDCRELSQNYSRYNCITTVEDYWCDRTDPDPRHKKEEAAT